MPGLDLGQVFGKDIELIFEWTSFFVIFIGDKFNFW